LPELFERILRQRRPSGLIGRYATLPKPTPPEDDLMSGSGRLFPGLLRYYDLTGDSRALEAAVGMARFILSRKDEWQVRLQAKGAHFIEAWISEPMAMLYGATGDTAYLDFVGLIGRVLGAARQGLPCSRFSQHVARIAGGGADHR